MNAVSSGGSLPKAGATPRNLSSHLLGVVVASLAAMALVAALLVAWNASVQWRVAEAEMATTARAISVALDQRLLITRTALESLAATVGGNGDPEQLYRAAVSVQAKHPSWSHVILRDADGRLVFTTAVPYGAPMPAVADAAPQVAEVIATGRPQIIGLLYGPVSGKLVAGVLVPVRGQDGRRSALIALEGGQAECEETRRILRELEGRIDALRLVHSRLYEASQVRTVELGGHLRELCGNSVALYGRGHAGGIAFRSCVDAVHVDHDTAVSLGLIANSAKHAFPDEAGTITLNVGAPSRDTVHLRLSDDGVGLPPARTRSSGMRLIGMLAQQVGVEPEWGNTPGTSLTLTLGAKAMQPAG